MLVMLVTRLCACACMRRTSSNRDDASLGEACVVSHLSICDRTLKPHSSALDTE